MKKKLIVNVCILLFKSSTVQGGLFYKFQNIGCLVQLHHGDLHVVSISTEFLLLCDSAILF